MNTALLDSQYPLRARHLVTVTRLAAIALLALAGCIQQPVAGPAAPMAAGDAVGTTQADADFAQNSLDAAKDDRLGRVASDSDAADKALAENRTADARGAISVQQAHLEGVQRSAEESAKLATAEQHRAEGRAVEAEKTLGDLRDSAKTDAVRIADLTRERDAANLARDKALDDFRDEAAKNMARQEKAIEDALKRAAAAEDARNDAVRKKQIVVLNWIGAVFTVLAGAVIGIGGMFLGWTFPVLKRLVPAAAICGIVALFAFAAAQFIASRWFWPVMGGSAALVFVLAGAYFYRSERAKQSAAQKAAVMDVARPILDKAYEGGTAKLSDVAAQLKADGSATVQDLLDAIVFNPLSAATKNTPVQATVHLMRAEEKGAIQLN